MAEVVWVNELGGITYRFPAAGQHVKWSPWHLELDLAREAERLRWSAPYVRVPRVLEIGSDADGQWLRTETLPGWSAVDPRWAVKPWTAARAIGTGLRTLHDRLPVEECPFSWSVAARAVWIRNPADRWLIKAAPPVDRLVVCHGDPCVPNTLLDDAGAFAGVVDLGFLGVADRWADLAVATYSLGWNFAGDWDGELYDAYGIERDPVRIDFYRRLWDAA